jgi:hypothetical protein
LFRGKFGTHERNDKCIRSRKTWKKKQIGRAAWTEIILNCILRKWGARIWIKIMRLKIGPTANTVTDLWVFIENLKFLKCRSNYWFLNQELFPVYRTLGEKLTNI